ncbi:MAG: hypothetical protein AABW59_05150 [archaeon]
MTEKVFITIDGSGTRVRLENGTSEIFKPKEIFFIRVEPEGPRVILETARGHKEYISKQSYENLRAMAASAAEKQSTTKTFAENTINDSTKADSIVALANYAEQMETATTAGSSKLAWVIIIIVMLFSFGPIILGFIMIFILALVQIFFV